MTAPTTALPAARFDCSLRTPVSARRCKACYGVPRRRPVSRSRTDDNVWPPTRISAPISRRCLAQTEAEAGAGPKPSQALPRDLAPVRIPVAGRQPGRPETGLGFQGADTLRRRTRQLLRPGGCPGPRGISSGPADRGVARNGCDRQLVKRRQSRSTPKRE
jgi:hypothetical protein